MKIMIYIWKTAKDKSFTTIEAKIEYDENDLEKIALTEFMDDHNIRPETLDNYTFEASITEITTKP